MPCLVEEYRGTILENTHHGRICVVDENGHLLSAVGDPMITTFYRSASKFVQVLPVFVHHLDEKYHLTETESIALAGSLAGQPCQLEAVLHILEKTGYKEEDLIVLPTFPACPKARDEMIRKNLPPRKALHNCAGKHLGAMMLSEYLTGDHKNYWQTDSAAQQEILHVISVFSDLPKEEIGIGIDGCGVPVFAVPQQGIANAFRLLACPDKLENHELREAVEKFTARASHNNIMIRGAGFLCSILNEDENIIAKGGAEGVYGLGLKKERLGISLKIEDGSEHSWPLMIAEILRQLHYDGKETIQKLEQLCPPIILNSLDLPVGESKMVFRL